MSSGPELPSGTVTFLFADIEGSTRLLSRLGQERYGEVLDDHTRILRAAFTAHGGQVVDTQGDSFFVAFRRAREAVAAALEAQRELSSHDWPDGAPVQVRMGLHTGEPAVGEERYLGLGVHRAARIGAAGHGGQVLLSQSTRELQRDDPLPEVRCRDLGPYRLKDLEEPERIYQLEAPGLRTDFPPLKTERRRRRVDRRLIPVAVVLAGGAVAAGVLLSRGSSGSAQASAGVAADSVGVFDAGNGTLIAQAPVRTGPSAVAVGEGSIWVANVNDDSVSRINPKTNQSVQTIPVGNGPAGIEVGSRFVWVANGLDGTVSKIDPRTETVVQNITVGNQPSGVAYGAGAVWVANSSDRTVMRIDERSGAVGAAIPAGAGADGIAVGDAAIWVTSESAGSVSRIDPRTGSVVATINIGSGASAVAVGAGAVWVANSLDDTVSRIDTRSNKVRATIQVGAGPSGISIGQDSVWVTNELGGTLSEIDPARNKVVRTIETGNRPEGVALSGHTMYVSVRTSSSAHRGGTLTVFGPPHAGVPVIDPAVVYDTDSWQALILTNDGLTGFKRVGGSQGTRLVPDLATSLPSAIDGGKTYTFQLRPGIRYSTGELVRPADFRRAIERALANRSGPGASFFSAILGADACVRAPMHCDLSDGILIDSAANTLTFHLKEPDPDLLYKLAIPTAAAVPASTPLKQQRTVPATGPYMFASYDSNAGMRLVRNPHFNEWSAAAQPNGYPDEIVWKFFGKADEDISKAALMAVTRGTADVTSAINEARVPSLRVQYASQLHINPTLSTFYFSLNTRLPPFNDLKARRAVNYAVDRNRLVALLGGSDLNQPSCQVLPPNFVGYRRYCPYTIHRSTDGRYVGPDAAKAQQLVGASRTKGQEVIVWTIKPFVPHGGAYFVSVLRSLGYKARLTLIPPGRYEATVTDVRQKVQVGLVGWVADYASPSDFFSPLFSCHAIHVGSVSNYNRAEFCDPRIDAEITQARALQTSDPQAASRLWSKIDREIVDQAPFVVITNSRAVEFVSRRVGNYTYSPPVAGALLDQLWVK